MERNELVDKIKKLINNKCYKEIKDMIMKANFGEDLEERIKNRFKKLDMDFVSVRSSAFNEDGENKSFAGQYNTLLNVKLENLLNSVKLCWSSLYSENVIEYSNEINITGMNVIVQKMINADYAGVAFSVDPTSDTKNYSVIEIAQGLGEKMVSGECTPTKLLVRRQTSHIDLKIGDILIDEDIVKKIEELVLAIENIYQVQVDIEFAILKDTVYVLQARPITAITPTAKPFSLSISRPNSLIEKSIYFNGEYKGIKMLTNNLYYFNPLFIYNPDTKSTAIYYNEYDLEEDPRLIYYYMDIYFDYILKVYDKIKLYIKELNEIIDNKKEFDISSFIDKLVYIYPFSSLGQLAGHFEKITPRLKEILYDYRFKYDYIIHKSCDYLLDYVENNLPDKLKPYKNFITLEEYIKDTLPNIDVLEKRKKGYMFFEEEVVLEKFELWLKNKNIYIKNEEKRTLLKGQVVFCGDVEGTVCKVFNEEDFEKVNFGDILVTPMTTPKFIKVIKKVKGIITDEGGITCHAAIISRELKIPCIVGCKDVTKTLEDGQVVKINGSTGSIKVLK